MINFRIGQKVVYIGGADHPEFFAPQIGEIITIKSACIKYLDSYDIVEYPLSKTKKLQSFTSCVLRPLDEILREQSESDLSRIEKQINEQIPVEV